MQTRVVRTVWKAKRRRWRWSVGEPVFQGSNGFSKTVIGETQRRKMGSSVGHSWREGIRIEYTRFCRFHREREKAAWFWFQALGDTYSQADFRFLHRQ